MRTVAEVGCEVLEKRLEVAIDGAHRTLAESDARYVATMRLMAESGASM